MNAMREQMRQMAFAQGKMKRQNTADTLEQAAFMHKQSVGVPAHEATCAKAGSEDEVHHPDASSSAGKHTENEARASSSTGKQKEDQSRAASWTGKQKEDQSRDSSWKANSWKTEDQSRGWSWKAQSWNDKEAPDYQSQDWSCNKKW